LENRHRENKISDSEFLKTQILNDDEYLYSGILDEIRAGEVRLRSLKACKKYLRHHPDDLDIRFLMGRILLRDGKSDQATDWFEECIQKITKFINDVSIGINPDIIEVKLDHWVLSDSIILVIDTNRSPVFKDSLEFFLSACSSIMQNGMKYGFPFRGAIGGGDFYKDGEVMVSTALVNAARYEKKQEWLGAVLTPEALQVVEKAKDLEINEKGSTDIDLDSVEFKDFVRYGKIPWKRIEKEPKEAFAEETYYIKPYNMSEKDWATKYLPEHFKGPAKINNSKKLYAQK